jgi:hypothetical protein
LHHQNSEIREKNGCQTAAVKLIQQSSLGQRKYDHLLLLPEGYLMERCSCFVMLQCFCYDLRIS